MSNDFAEKAKQAFAKPYNLIALGNSDAHLWWKIGRTIDPRRPGKKAT